jgi:hypothetical protein
VPGVGAEHGQSGERHRQHRGAGHHGPPPEVDDEVRLAEPAGVAGEEHGRDERRRRDREHTEQQGRRVEPRGHRVAGAVADRDATGGDAADRRGEEERRDDRGQPEHPSVPPPAAGLQGGLAQGEADAAQDDPEAAEDHGDPGGGDHGFEHRGEPGPGDDQDEDQPDVVGLPDRGHGAVHQRPRPGSPVPVAGGEVPEAGAEVGTARAGVGGHRQQEDQRHHVGAGHGATLSGSVSGAAVSRASSASWCRHLVRSRSNRPTNAQAISA